MAGLKDTTAALAKMRRQVEALAGGAETSSGRMGETSDFGADPGALRMLSYVPEGLAPGAPLVVVLHGCTQRAEPHAEAAGWLTLAERCGFAVLAPEQTPANNPNRCFNWYEPGDARRGGGEAASIRAMVAHLVREHRLDARRVFVTGLSAGGAMASVMLATYPDVFAGGAIVAGLPYGIAGNLQEALGAMFSDQDRTADDLGALVRGAAPTGGSPPRVAIWHGGADATVRPHNAVDIARQWAAVHGLPAEPDETQRLRGRTRLLWRSPATGEVLIESNLVQGLGHGTPLSTGAPDGVGSVAPYMLEAGVSSSLEIARFWGLAQPAAAAEASTKPRKAAHATPRPAARESARPQPTSLGEQIVASVGGRVPAGVETVIAQAMKTAGLMK